MYFLSALKINIEIFIFFSIVQRWTSRLSKLETTMTMPCGLFGSADTVQPMPSPYRQDSYVSFVVFRFSLK